MKKLTRRQGLRMTGAAALAALSGLGPGARASSGQGPGKLAILSMVGHDITLVQHSHQIGTRLPPRGERLPMDSGLFDQRATLAMDREARKLLPAGEIVLMSAQGKMWAELQQDALTSSAGMKDMIATVTDIARQGGCRRALALMKHRGVAKIRLYDTAIGQGMLEGLGYYIDTTMNTIEVDSRDRSIGILAPYAYMKLLYIDADKVSLIDSEVSEAARGYAPEMGDTRHPWDTVSAETKARLLTSLMEQEIARLVPRLLQPA